jgi:hypothetical protein
MGYVGTLLEISVKVNGILEKVLFLQTEEAKEN